MMGTFTNLKECVRDALRYRYIREAKVIVAGSTEGRYGDEVDVYRGKELDRVVDEAMKRDAA